MQLSSICQTRPCSCRGYDRADEVILLGLQWLRNLPQGLCAEAGVQPDQLGWEPGSSQHLLLQKLLALTVGEPRTIAVAALLGARGSP